MITSEGWPGRAPAGFGGLPIDGGPGRLPSDGGPGRSWATVPRVTTPERPFDDVVEALIEDQFAANPVLGSALGVIAYDSDLPDLSADAIAAQERREDAWVSELSACADADLTGQQVIDRDLALMVLRGRAIMRDWADWRRNPDHYAGVALTGVFTLLLNRLRPEAELAAAVASRLEATPELLAQARANLDPQLAHPAILRRSLGQIGAGALMP